MGPTKDHSLAIVLWFLNFWVVPENKIKFIVFSFRPIDSVVFLKLTDFFKSHYLLTPFLWMLVQWTTQMYLFHTSKNNVLVEIYSSHNNIIQYIPVITNSSGPVKLLCYIESFLNQGCTNNKIQHSYGFRLIIPLWYWSVT